MTKPGPRVVIVGAGFAGLWAARGLANERVSVTLVDRNNYHLFLPLLYQISAAEIEPEEIAYPIRTILRRSPNIAFDLAEVRGIDFAAKKVCCDDHCIPFDWLILATGSAAGYFNIPGAADNSYALKTMADGIRLRNHILCCFEHAAHEEDEKVRTRRLTFVIAGGGPTGVEFAGALAELACGPLKRDFPEIDFARVRIILLEARPNLLDMLPARQRDYARRRLEKMGVEVRTGSAVSCIKPDQLTLRDGTVIHSETVVWTAGVKGSLFSRSDIPRTTGDRIETISTLQSATFPEVYVAGDVALHKIDGHILPQVAPVAIAQGRWAARNVLRQISGRPPLPFRHRDKGTMITIGRNKGVAKIGALKLRGFPAWLLWTFVHLFKLVGFRNRLLVLINWAWDYLFFERSVRLILYSGKREKEC